MPGRRISASSLLLEEGNENKKGQVDRALGSAVAPHRTCVTACHFAN